MAPVWPAKMLVTLTLVDRGAKTLLTISKVAVNASPDEIRVFGQNHDSMTMGWSGSFETLEAYLASAG